MGIVQGPAWLLKIGCEPIASHADFKSVYCWRMKLCFTTSLWTPVELEFRLPPTLSYIGECVAILLTARSHTQQ